MLSRPSEPPLLLWLDDQALIASQDVARFHSFADPALQDEGLGSIRSGLTFKFQTKNSRELVFAGEGLDGPPVYFPEDGSVAKRRWRVRAPLCRSNSR
jgi:hypothetical protein